MKGSYNKTVTGIRGIDWFSDFGYSDPNGIIKRNQTSTARVDGHNVTTTWSAGPGTGTLVAGSGGVSREIEYVLTFNTTSTFNQNDVVIFYWKVHLALGPNGASQWSSGNIAVTGAPETGGEKTLNIDKATGTNRITITKQAIPNDPQQFNFKGNGTIGTFGIIGSGSNTSYVAAGTYNVSEIVPSGWSLTSISIQEKSPTNSSFNLNTNSTRLKVDSGEWVNVTFTDQNEGRINIVKDAVPNDPQSFQFKSNNTAQIPGFSLVDNGGVNNRTFHVKPGTYNVSEIVPSGWSLTSISIQEKSPANSSFNLNTNSTRLKVDSGEWVNVTFTDSSLPVPKVTLTKTLTQPAGGTALVGDPVIFTIKIKNTGTTTLVTVPLTDTYDPSNLQYNALTPPTPAPDSVAVGKISWIDLTGPLGDLSPNQEFTIVIAFKATAPTIGPTINLANTTYAIDQYQQQTRANYPANLIIVAQGRVPRAVVGGIMLPTNKLAILEPYLALLGLIGLASILSVRKVRKA